MVLIETYWNVNCIYTPSHVRAPGINRNILECKVISCPTESACLFVLIETYWNVKMIYAITEAPAIIVLIETYWNVKASRIYLCNRA